MKIEVHKDKINERGDEWLVNAGFTDISKVELEKGIGQVIEIKKGV